MPSLRNQPVFTCLLTAVIAVWLAVAPALVICTCDMGHAAVAAASHEQSACGHGACETQPAEPASSHETPHHDESITIDAVPQRLADTTAELPVMDIVVAILPDLELAAIAPHLCMDWSVARDAGPPMEIACAIASTILLI